MSIKNYVEKKATFQINGCFANGKKILCEPRNIWKPNMSTVSWAGAYHCKLLVS